MEQDPLWERLIEALDECGSAAMVAPGRIEVSLHGGEHLSRRVLIVMTPHEWDELATVMWGNVDDAIESVKQTLLRLEPHQGFAVYSDYQLWPSATPELPEIPEEEAMPGGTWITHDGRDIAFPEEPRE